MSVWQRLKSLMVPCISILLATTLKCHVKYQILGTFSTQAQKMRQVAVRRDIHRYLSVAWPSLDVWGGWLEELMAASTSHIWSTSCHFYQKQLSKLCKMSDVGLPLCPGNKMMWYNGRCILLLMWSITALRCITLIGRPSTTICKHLMVYIMSFLPKTTIKFHAKYHISGTLSARKMQWCATRRDIHCC